MSAELNADTDRGEAPLEGADMCGLTVGSLFSGIGGLDLGLERAGMRVIWQSELDPYAARVLANHWPEVPNLGDVTKIDWSSVERPDLICGGYPCQPFSYAGRRAGTEDARHLWPYFADALRLLRPRWALLENVPGHLSLGFGDVLADLASLGFDAEWELLPASAFGAPHLRYRLFVVAHASGIGRGEGSGVVGGMGAAGRSSSLADADSSGPQHWRSVMRTGERALGSGSAESRAQLADADCTLGHRSRCPSEEVLRPSPLERPGRRSGGGGHAWSTEPDVGRVAHGVPSRVDRLRCLGNAVVPQVAEWVGRQIVAAHNAQEAAA